MRRFFVPQGLLGSTEILLPKEVAHHIKTVLRLRQGADILLCDGYGQCCHGKIETLSSGGGSVVVVDHWFEEETALRFELIQALPSGDKFDLILQKNTELGVARFQPVTTDRCQFSVPANKLARKIERWQRIINEAARQSGRGWLPQVESPLTLEQAVSQCQAQFKLILWEEATQPIRDVLPCQPPESVAVVIGPEGGLSSAEVDCALKHGFIPVGLGPRILRTETAGFALSAILQFQYGDLNLVPKREAIATQS